MPITFYDIAADETREVTQRDVALMEIGTQAYGRLRAALNDTEAWVRDAVAVVNHQYPVADPTRHVDAEPVTGDL